MAQLDALLVYVVTTTAPDDFARRPQLGLYYIAQYATSHGYSVKVDNLCSNDLVGPRLVRLLRKNKCRLLGFYVDQENLWDLRRILPSLCEAVPDVRIVVGGPQVTADPYTVMERLPDVACAVIGDGELPFLQLLECQNFDEVSLDRCESLVYRSKEGMKETPICTIVNDLDIYPIPRRRELTVDEEFEFAPAMISGRGCPGRCAFCFEGSQSRHLKKLRLHSVDRFMEEFEYLTTSFDHSYICILDDTFVSNHKRLREICHRLIDKYDDRVKWYCEGRVDTLARHKDLMPLMIDAGLVRLQIGGESGNQAVLDAYRKGITLEQILDVVDQAHDNGLLSMHANFIIGGAHETKQTFEDTRNLAVELLRRAPGCAAVGASYFTPYPQTPMYDDPESYGIEIIDDEVLTGAGDRHAFCRTKELSRFEIIEMWHQYRSDTSNAMAALCKTLSRSDVVRQFEAYYKLGLATDWYDMLNVSGGLSRYFKATMTLNAKTLPQVKSGDFARAYPVRTVELVASRDKRFIVPLYTDQVRELDSLESILIELSAGKLTLDEIVKMVEVRLGLVDELDVRHTIIEKFKSFDEDFLVYWNTDERELIEDGEQDLA